MKRLPSVLPIAIASVLLISACTKDPIKPAPVTPGPDPAPAYTVPTTYNFTNVDCNGQLQRLDMVNEMKTYMATGKTQALDVQKLKDMFANVNNAFAVATLNTSGKDIKSKTFLPDQAVYETYFGNIVSASQSTVEGGEGVAGLVAS